MSIPLPLLRAEDVKARADFVAIAARYTSLRRAGSQFVGRCPFHSERHPSFYIHPEKKIFYCFGCEVGGDLLSFIMRAERCDFPRALQIASETSSANERAAKQPAREPAAAVCAAAGYIARQRKVEPSPRLLHPSFGSWPSLDCAAERAIEEERVFGAGSFT